LKYRGRPGFRHDQPDLTGILLVNLGTPEAPTTAAVRHYLAEFLSDTRVIEAPRLLWWLALNLVILRLRPPRSARAYASIWRAEGSPLMIHSRALAARLDAALAADGEPRRIQVRVAMRYGEPSIPTVMRELQDAGMRRLLVLPLFPQYSASTNASAFDAVFKELRGWRWVPELRLVADYFAEPAYLDALAARVRAHWAVHGQAERLLFSFHGIPERYFREGDPYFCQCQATAREVTQRLGLPRERWALSFQSRVGTEAWLKPYTDEMLADWPAAGVRSVQVLCPGFAVDCLETIDEIAVENRERFLHAGGERFEYIAALNEGDDHVAALATLLRRHLQGWAPLDTRQAALTDAPALALRSQRHKAMADEQLP
jgi:ferrochelatase